MTKQCNVINMVFVSGLQIQILNENFHEKLFQYPYLFIYFEYFEGITYS